MRRLCIFGVSVDQVSEASARNHIAGILREERTSGAIFAVNPEKVIRARGDAQLREILENSVLLLPDGIGIVLASKILGLGTMQRLAGCDFISVICEEAKIQGKSVALIGAKPHVNESARKALGARYPRLIVAGGRHGYSGPGGIEEVDQFLSHARPNVVFVALGSPRQEHAIDEWRRRHPFVQVWQGVGGSFDVLAGEVRRAPIIWQKFNMEWAYRLLTNPGRAFRQLSLLRFVWWIVKALMGRHVLAKP